MPLVPRESGEWFSSNTGLEVRSVRSSEDVVVGENHSDDVNLFVV